MINYAARLEKLRTSMEKQNIGLVYLTAGANLFYLTGIHTRDDYRTDHNRYGDYIVGGYIGLDGGVIVVAARMGAQYFVGEMQGEPWFEPPRLLFESEEPLDVLKEIVSRFDLEGKRVALDNHAWAQSMFAFRNVLPETPFVLASDLLTSMRMIKEPAEIELMRQAGDITDTVWQKTLPRLQVGVTEFEIATEIDYQFRVAGAQYNSFPTTVRFRGPAHADEAANTKPTERTLQPGDSVTFDFGCVYEGYCSDFGRSAFVGEPPSEYVRIHEIVLEAQRQALSAMKAGQITVAEAKAIGRAPIEESGYGPCFTHRLGHGIGITVHGKPFLDVMDHSLLQANMTFTVEPSIRSVPDRPIEGGYANRVEDVVVVTKEGAVPLYNTDRKLYIID